MQIAIHGYGKMGRLVANATHVEPDASVATIVDANAAEADYKDISSADLSGIDVVIDFSNARAVLPMLKAVAKLKQPPALVIASSGWNTQRAEAERIVKTKQLRALYGANFALATNLFIKIAAYTADLVNKVGDFDTTISETHHRAKADMPSGTAIHIGESILPKLTSKKRLVYGSQKQQVAEDELQIASIRSGFNLGEHSVIFDAPDERLILTQQTTNRLAYAQGAVKAAKWLLAKKPGKLYLFEDYLNEVLGK